MLISSARLPASLTVLLLTIGLAVGLPMERNLRQGGREFSITNRRADRSASRFSTSHEPQEGPSNSFSFWPERQADIDHTMMVLREHPERADRILAQVRAGSSTLPEAARVHAAKVINQRLKAFGAASRLASTGRSGRTEMQNGHTDDHKIWKKARQRLQTLHETSEMLDRAALGNKKGYGNLHFHDFSKWTDIKNLPEADPQYTPEQLEHAVQAWSLSSSESSTRMQPTIAPRYLDSMAELMKKGYWDLDLIYLHNHSNTPNFLGDE